jgi:4-amino-4-deoxy-L-arabinose transferase-like glycosyltransferase
MHEPRPAVPDEDERMTRTQRAIFGVFIACLFASLFYFVHPWYDVTVDGSIFIVTARSLAAGDGYTYLGDPFLVRPPGFPLLIAPFVANGGTNFLALNLFMGLIGATGVVLLFAFARSRLGFSLALLTALTVWLNPGYERLTTQVMSDVPGSTLLLLCLVVERWARRAPSPRREILLGLCIGLSAHVRSIVILLVPAIAMSRLLLRGKHEVDAPWRRFAARRLLLFAAVSVLTLVPWSLRSSLDPPRETLEQTAVYSYGVGMLRADPQDPDSPLLPLGAILERIPLRSRQIAYVLGSRMWHEVRGNDEPGGASRFANTALTLLLLGSSLFVLVKRREPAELFVAATLAVLATYFGFGARLLLPVYVLTLPAAVEVARDLAARFTGARGGAVVAGGALALLIAIDFAPRHGWREIEREHGELVALCQAVQSAVPADARIGAVIGAHYSVFLDRPVYSLQIAARRANDFEAANRVIEKHAIDTIVLSNRTAFEHHFADYVRQRYGEPERVGPALIWRLRR